MNYKVARTASGKEAVKIRTTLAAALAVLSIALLGCSRTEPVVENPKRPQPIARGFLLTPIRWPVEIMRDLPNGLGPGDTPRWEVRCPDLDPGGVFWPAKKAVEVTPNNSITGGEAMP